ncbi:ABC transporter permease [Halalkalicoccus subterraneus]|uniref:ABC transporter permease n=1 Tax=Halalkalicoccus subterraneus TaxID=2675002 RepID=UPI000EFABD40|nr:ABC transporter permease subunit [Halalkalicoccus subterraneus]
MSISTSQYIDREDVIFAGQLAVPVVILLLWQLLSMVTGQFALASPAESFNAMVEGFQTGWMTEGLQITLIEVIIAYILAVIVGVWAGVFLGVNDFMKDVFEPIVLGVYAIPKVTLYPLFLFIFALGMDAIIAFGWFHGVFPIAILTMRSMDVIKEEHTKVGKSLRLSRWQQFRHITVPSILPGLIIGLRLGFNLTFLGVVLGEMFAARAGLGHSLVEFIGGVQIDRILAIIIVLVAIATVVNLFFFALESRIGARGREGAEVRM